MRFSPKAFLRRAQIARESNLLISIRQAVALDTIKRVEIEILSQDNKRVIRRFRFTPPNDAKGRKARFMAADVDYVLDNFVESFERDNPDHKYRLVVCEDKYKLVWTPDPEPDVQKQMLEDMVTAAKAAQGNSPCEFTMPLPEPAQTFAPGGEPA